jgi:TetR/AcrR family transcriptional regulator, transcriptional repressor for nem operon
MPALDTKTEIMDVAQDLMQRWGVNGMSYEHISKAVGIRKASIHYYFPSKDALVIAVLERYNEYFLKLVDGILAANITPRQKLARYASLFEATLESGKHDRACLCGMLGAELKTLGSKAAEHVRHFYVENERRLAMILESGKKSGDFHFQGSAAATAALIFALLEGAGLIARAHGGAAHFRNVSRQLERLLQA